MQPGGLNLFFRRNDTPSPFLERDEGELRMRTPDGRHYLFTRASTFDPSHLQPYAMNNGTNDGFMGLVQHHALLDAYGGEDKLCSDGSFDSNFPTSNRTNRRRAFFTTPTQGYRLDLHRICGAFDKQSLQQKPLTSDVGDSRGVTTREASEHQTTSSCAVETSLAHRFEL